MTSLAEVYEGHVGEEAGPRQVYAGVGLFSGGALLLVAGIVIATTDVLAGVGFRPWQSWELAGILAGLGLPAVAVGMSAVLPASRRVRATAVVGATVAVVGVGLFAHAFPTYWTGDATNLAPLATGVYFVGAIVTLWCLFTGIANFKTRNDPAGTVTVELTRGGETRVVEVDREDIDGDIGAAAQEALSDGGDGGVGFLGETPDGGVATQTNDVENRTAGAVRSSPGVGKDSRTGPADPTPASDGGATEPGVRGPADDAEVMRAGADPEDAADAYCGNCEHFEYVQTSRGMRPFCGLQDGVMEDMDACEEWSPNQPD